MDKRLIEYVQGELFSIANTRYDDKTQALLYQLGILQRLMAELMLDDSKNVHKFKQKIARIRAQQQQ